MSKPISSNSSTVDANVQQTPQYSGNHVDNTKDYSYLETEEQKKENKSFSNKIVAICIIANVLFTIAIFAVKIFNYAIVIPDSLIVAWFGFWGAELVALASIKKNKIKNKYE